MLEPLPCLVRGPSGSISAEIGCSAGGLRRHSSTTRRPKEASLPGPGIGPRTLLNRSRPLAKGKLRLTFGGLSAINALHQGTNSLGSRGINGSRPSRSLVDTLKNHVLLGLGFIAWAVYKFAKI